MKKFYYLVFFAGILILFSCTPEPNPVINKIIFVGQVDQTGGSDIACYWQDNQRIELPVPAGCNSSVAFNITTRDKDIYISGSYKLGSIDKACYWKNGELVTLPYNSHAYGEHILVINTDIYVSGFYYRTTGSGVQNPQPLLWKNGVLVNTANFPENQNGGKLVAINQQPALLFPQGIWRDNIYTQWGTASGEGSVYLSGIDASGSDFLVVGIKRLAAYQYKPQLWKNSENASRDLPVSGGNWSPLMLKINGTDTAIVGHQYAQNTYHTLLWKNNVASQLPVYLNLGFDTMEIIGSDIYVGGEISETNSKACYSKNGVITQLPDYGQNSYVYGSAVLSYVE